MNEILEAKKVSLATDLSRNKPNSCVLQKVSKNIKKKKKEKVSA